MSHTDVTTFLLAADMTWVEAGLILCFGMFLAVVMWVIFAKRDRFHDAARIPLQEDRPLEPRYRADRGHDRKEATHVR